MQCWCHLPIVAMVPECPRCPRCPAPAQLRTKGQCLGKQSERGWALWAVQGAVIVHSPYSPQLNEIRRCHCFQNQSLSRLNGNNGVAQKLVRELRNNTPLDCAGLGGGILRASIAWSTVAQWAAGRGANMSDTDNRSHTPGVSE